MFRKFFLRRTLTRVGRQLIGTYESQSFYTSAQVEKVLDTLKISKDREYCLTLFVDPLKRMDVNQDVIRDARKSLFRYFVPDILEVDIDSNRYRSILGIDESPPRGAHTPIEKNSYITPFTSGQS